MTEWFSVLLTVVVIQDMCMGAYTKDKVAKCRTPVLELLIKVVFDVYFCSTFASIELQINSYVHDGSTPVHHSRNGVLGMQLILIFPLNTASEV